MIFKTKREFEQEVQKRINEIEERKRFDRRLIELEDQIMKLTWRVDYLEEIQKSSVKTQENIQYPKGGIELCTTQT